MQVEILKSFPYIAPISRKVVYAKVGEIIDIEESYALGWIKSALAKEIKPDTETLKAKVLEQEPKAIKTRKTKAIKPRKKKADKE